MLGAKVIEKHITIDRSIGGPDASFSMNEHEFSEMVKAVRDAEKAIGTIDYSLNEKTIKNRVFARSLYVVRDIKKGEVFTEENVRSIRPGNGMHPKHLKDIIGKKAACDIETGEAFKAEFIETGSQKV